MIDLVAEQAPLGGLERWLSDPAINEVMPPFEGDESLRRALAVHLSALGASQPPGGAR